LTSLESACHDAAVACGLRVVLLLLLLAARTTGADAASPVKVCRKTCATETATCVRAVRTELRSGRSSCAGAGDAKACKRNASRVAKEGKRICRVFRKSCRACCKTGGADCARPPEVPKASGDFPIPERRVLDEPPFPPQPDGTGFVLLSLPDGDFGFDPNNRGPASAAAECAAAVLSCFEPTLRNWAGCFARVPRCTTSTPWEGDAPMCCAAACQDRFQELLRAGVEAPVAFASAIWEAPSCMPGLDGHVRGAGIP
jgi:hypothetical protein